MNPVASYWVKIAAGTVAFVVWLLSTMSNTPFSGMQATAQQILFLAACAAFGWGVVQGSSAVRALTIFQGKE